MKFDPLQFNRIIPRKYINKHIHTRLFIVDIADYNVVFSACLSTNRAQIHNLSEFDKVVGGLCWCIVHSGEAVDVDILFTENATIGQRITLSEAIVTAMRQMNCPHPLQPHQIQGGITGADFVAINPVITWLVKKFVSMRGIREAQLRSTK